MKTFREIIDAWISQDALAKDLKIPLGHVCVMRHRDSIPSDYWMGLVKAAKRRGVKGITIEVLHKIKAARKVAAPKHGRTEDQRATR